MLRLFLYTLLILCGFCYNMRMNILYCGDCVQVMSDFESEIIDLTVTSPPYDDLRTYNGYSFDFNEYRTATLQNNETGWRCCVGCVTCN